MGPKLLLRAGQYRPAASILRQNALRPLAPRRMLMGPIFRAAKSGITLAAGATAGGAAYINYKVQQTGSAVSEKFDQVSEWVSDRWDSVSDVFKEANERFQSQTHDDKGQSIFQSSEGGDGKGEKNGSQSSGDGASSGGSDGGGGDIAVAAVAAVAANDEDDTMVILTRKMIEVRNLLLQIDKQETLRLPSIVVIGSQSSGKSSVLEAIVGHEFLPKGGNMVTRRPIELTLIHSPESASEYCDFPELRLGKITDFSHVQRTLTELNMAVPAEEVVSDDPILLTIYSPHVPDLTLIDLPGYIQVVAAGQPHSLKTRIADLCDKYINAPNVILAISAADVDLANSTALRASRRVDPRGERTIGVITKMDLVDPERGYDLLTNQEYPLQMGYVGVITKTPLHLGFSNRHSNMTQSVALDEERYFSQYAEFTNLQTGVLTLRRKLMSVLETTMARSLVPTTQAIRRELEESAYKFKVEYNDRSLTPQSYLAQSIDAFKLSFKDLTAQFGREQVRQLVKAALDQRVLDTLAQNYWNLPPELESATPNVLDNVPLSSLSSSSMANMGYWQTKLDNSTANLTKLGIGRLSAQLLADTISLEVRGVVDKTPFRKHPLAVQAVERAVTNILEPRLFSTADQVENSIKPFKYEVEIDDREWAQSREHSYNLLKEELRQATVAFNRLKDMVGSSKLNSVLQYLDSRQRMAAEGRLAPADAFGFSPALLDTGKEARFLQIRCDELRMRMAAVKSKRCISRENKYQCPEIFLDVVADKLTATAVLFLNFELLSDFYYSFPRELDSQISALSEKQIQELAEQDPQIREQINLQRRRDLLKLALAKIQTVTEMTHSSASKR